MTDFTSGPITQIKTDTPRVHAFRVEGHIDDNASEALAKHMNAVFDRYDTVNMLLDLTEFTRSDWDTMLNRSVLTSRLRALTHVTRYAIIGPPERGKKLIDMMDKVIPVKAKAFKASEMSAAWEFVGAHPRRPARGN